MKTKTYEVSFKVTVPAHEEWEDLEWDGCHGKYLRIDPGMDEPYICVPADAEITAVPDPLADGFYVSPGSRTMYQRLDGEWTFWSDSFKDWRESCCDDDDARRSEFERVNVVV